MAIKVIRTRHLTFTTTSEDFTAKVRFPDGKWKKAKPKPDRLDTDATGRHLLVVTDRNGTPHDVEVVGGTPSPHRPPRRTEVRVAFEVKLT